MKTNWEATRMLKNDIAIKKRSGLSYLIGDNDKPITYRPWLGDIFSFSYDFLMRKMIFPGKLNCSIDAHHKILSKELADIHLKNILELSAGSGDSVNYLNNDNHYTGTDISKGLLLKAARRFSDSGFKDPMFLITGVDDLPFKDGVFDLCLCILSLNFYNDLHAVLKEVKRVLVPGGEMLCSVPVPERNKMKRSINGKLRTAEELSDEFHRAGLIFKVLPEDNGTLLYFKGVKGLC